MIGIISFECIYSINVNWNIDHDIETFMSDKEPYRDLITNANNMDNDLYRMEKTNYLTLNDGAWYDYKGISTFSSMAYEDVSKFQRMMGMAGNNINSYYYRYEQTPIYNTMFNIKYLMGNYVNDDYYSFVYSNDYYNLNEYKYSSSIMYMVDEDVKNWHLEEYNPFLNQSNFVSYATGYEGVFNPLKVVRLSGGGILDSSFKDDSNGEFLYFVNDGEDALELTINNDKEQNIYLYVGGSKVNSFEVDGAYYSITSDEYYVVNIGKKEVGGVNVTINFNDSEDGSLKFYAYALNEEVFNRFYEDLKTGFLNVEKYNDAYITGSVTAKDNQVAFTTIAYDEGWSAYVDGKKVDTFKIANAYLGFNVPSGTHEIRLVFYPKMLKEGLIISGVSLLVLFIYFICYDRVRIKKKR